MRKLYLFIITVLLITIGLKNDVMAQSNAKIIYVGDPMCSWCYGFAPEIASITDHFNTVEFELILGGLRPYGEETMADLSDFLREHWEEIAEKTGQEFKYDLLKHDDFVYDTEPASRAVVAAQQQNSDITLAFYKAVQKAFYKENKSTHDINTYLAIAEKLDLDKEQFETDFYTDEVIQATRQNFITAQEMGVRGFPTLLLQVDEKTHLISNGYQEAEMIIKKIDKLLEE